MNVCGRGFGDDAAASFAATSRKLATLKVLRLGGAYRLTDSGLQALLKAAPYLTELHLPQCSRIQGSALEDLPRLTPQLR